MKKEDWVVAAPVILTVAGLEFTVHNGGQHIVVYAEDKEFHLWPSTGKWRVKEPNKLNAWGYSSDTFTSAHQGVRGLVRLLSKEK